MERNYQLEWKQEEERRQHELKMVARFHAFLQGTIPKGYTVTKIKRMNPDQAMAVVWFLQEGCHLIPDNYEMCHECKTIYDSNGEGVYMEKTGRCYCDSCDPRPYDPRP